MYHGYGKRIVFCCGTFTRSCHLAQPRHRVQKLGRRKTPGKQLRVATMLDSVLGCRVMQRVASRWHQLTVLECNVQQMRVSTQRAICDLLRTAPYLVTCNVYLHNWANKTHAPFSPPEHGPIIATPLVDRPCPVDFWTRVPFQMFVAAVCAPNLRELSCCVSRCLDQNPYALIIFPSWSGSDSPVASRLIATTLRLFRRVSEFATATTPKTATTRRDSSWATAT